MSYTDRLRQYIKALSQSVFFLHYVGAILLLLYWIVNGHKAPKQQDIYEYQMDLDSVCLSSTNPAYWFTPSANSSQQERNS